MSLRKTGIMLTICVALIAAACAEVTVRKIPTPTQYTVFGDDKQTEADNIEGIRYYLPRPFVAIKKEFPFKSETYFVHGQVSANGRSVVINTDDKDKIGLLNNITGCKVPRSCIVPVGTLFVRTETKERLLNKITPQGLSSDTSSSAPKLESLPWFEKKGIVTINAKTGRKMAQGGEPIRLDLQIPASQKPDPFKTLDFETIRGLYLVPVSGTKINKEKAIPLPMQFYDKTNGKYEYRAYFPGLKNGAFILAIRYVAVRGEDLYDELVVYTEVVDPLLLVFSDPDSNKNPNLGETDQTTVIGPIPWSKGITTSVTNGVAGSGQAPLKFSVTIPNLAQIERKGVEGAIPGVTELSRIRMAVLDANLKPTNTGPFFPAELIEKTASGITFEYNGPSDMVAGNHTIVLHLKATNPNVAGQFITYTVFEEVPSLMVNDLPVFTLPPIKGARFSSPPEAPTPDPAPSHPNPSTDGDTNTVPSPGKPDTTGQTNSTTSEGVQNTSEQTTPGGAGSMTVSSGGDPNTNPLVSISDLYDIIYLPDFDEQYAVHAKAKGSLANLSMGLENGWMVEKFNATIDNRAIANFLFFQIDKTLDLLRNMVRLDKGLILPPQPVATDPAATPQGSSSDLERKPPWVLLKVHLIDYAVPGLYPILKPREIISKKGYAEGLVAGQVPYLQVRTRSEKVIELVDISPKPVATGNTSIPGVIRTNSSQNSSNIDFSASVKKVLSQDPDLVNMGVVAQLQVDGILDVTLTDASGNAVAQNLVVKSRVILDLAFNAGTFPATVKGMRVDS